MNRRYLIIGAVVLALLIVGYYNSPGSVSEQATNSYAPVMQEGDVYSADYGETMVASAGLRASKAMIEPSTIPPQQPPGYQTGGGKEFMPKERLIIKTAQMSVVVDDVQQAAQAVVDFAANKGGFEVNRSVQKEGVGYSASVTVRIPAEAFDQGLEAARALGEVRSQNINGQDVTEEFVDVQAQLHNLRATEKQFLDILRQAAKIEDILSVQRELTNVRAQIESLEGRKKYLEQSAALSTLTVYFSTNPETLPVVDDQDKWKPVAVAKEALRDLLDIGKAAVNVLIRIVIYIPIWIIIGVIIYVGQRWYRKSHGA